MRTSMIGCFTLFCIVGIVAVPDIRGQNSRELVLKEAEPRLRAVYDRGEFRAKRFRADWLDDGSGYTVSEPVPGADKRVLVRYDAASGKRTVLDSSEKEEAGRSDKISPDGRSLLYSDRGNLYVRDLRSDRKIPLTKNAAGGSISNSQATWSPDGKRIAFVQSDASDVKLRSVLIPGDPSYPEVKEIRFARVGGTIATLRALQKRDSQSAHLWMSVHIRRARKRIMRLFEQADRVKE